MKLPLLIGVNQSLKFLLCVVVTALGSNNVRAQEIEAYKPSPPAVELLTLSGSKPTFLPSGDGISSMKASHLYGLGVTQVKPFDLTAAMPLPAGYSLFNKLAFLVDSKAVFSGPNDHTFRVPSATTKSVFDRLRVLYAERDEANPEVPRWIDVTLLAYSFESHKEYLPKEEFEKRLPNFTSRTLHAFLREDARLFVVAVKDPSVARDSFSADLVLSGEAPEHAMEGRRVTYDLKVTNLGPDAATDVRLHGVSSIMLDFVSVTSDQGKCRHEAGNIYCRFAKIDKGESVSVKSVERVRWGYEGGSHNQDTEDNTIDVESAEPDPAPHNNRINLTTTVMLDSNKAPIAELLSPKDGDLFGGPAATVNIVAKASDPDGFVKKIEFFDQGEAVGEGTPTRDGQFELVYKNVSFGRHWLSLKVTDNLGRETEVMGGANFFVNGRAEIKITSPTNGHLQNRADREMIVKVQATHPELKIKDVFVVVLDGSDPQKALPIGGDEYSVKVHQNCEYRCELKAMAIDEAGVETLSETVVFTIPEAPEVTLYQYDGETFHKLSEDGQFESSRGFTLAAEAKHESYHKGKIVKMEFFLDEKSICSYDTTDFGGQSYPAMPCPLDKVSPGRYRVHAVATDNDGSVGKSALVMIEIKKR